MKIGQWFSIRCVGSERFHSLEVKCTSVNIVGARFGNDVDDAACCASKLCARTGGNYLKFFHGLECDIDRGSLTSKLFTEKTVVVIAAVEAHVVEYASLPGK